MGLTRRLARWASRSVLNAIDPTPLRAGALFNAPGAHRAGLICIYRSRNARNVEKMVSEAVPAGLTIALWALDSPVPGLSHWTIGSGPGPRMRLLNRLCEVIPLPTVDHLVVCDDDVVFTKGNIAQLLCAAKRCGFGIAQPAHDAKSHSSHGITIRRALTLARLTTFVEVGPVFVVSKEWLTSVIPFPEAFGMGWGLDLVWSDLHEKGCRLGIIDAICIRHLGLTGREYDVYAERKRLDSLLSARNLQSLGQMQRCLAMWRFWQLQPPWRPPLTLRARR